MVDFLGIYWGAPDRFWFFPIFLFVIILLARRHRLTSRAIKRLVSQKHQKVIFKNFSHKKQAGKLIASCSALILLFIALLQPQWHKKEQTIQQEGRDLLILLDISRSMLAQDIKPNRLEFIKLKIRSLLQKLEFERVGLILFSGSAFVQCPLTTDYSAFLLFLEQVDVETIASGTTAIDGALRKAIQTYKQYPDHKNKLTLLVTDGEDFSLRLEQIKAEAKKENIKIFALGAGTPEGAPIPKVDIHGNALGHETDESGNIVLSRLNEPLLKNICSALDGQYVRTTYDDSDLDYIVSLISKFEKETFGDKKFSLYEDQYPWFLGAAWGLLAIAWVL